MTVIEPITVAPKRAAELLGISRSFLYVLMKRNELPFIKLGNRRLLEMSALRSLLQAGRCRQARKCT